jgi:hypothetical protein
MLPLRDSVIPVFHTAPLVKNIVHIVGHVAGGTNAGLVGL